ncbi:hypothetical protein GCM10027275_43420 [Rhabdobacter roseus]|uniref:Uncharacterized protein n=1 Tax=Rhabdobacter roseus TaxID=1655419 RepID=A0A840TRQ5_9BACT|nr:hypothetical protein [Rhabdobacter roseus]MBB5286601.1 hypothetical protein [Rhabdobacter roseus]
MNILYNNSICNSSILGYHPKFTKEQEQQIFATFFEQLLLFDCIVISTDKDNFSLTFLISRLGLETVERLIRSGYIKFSIKSAIIVTGTGHQKEDGSIDESVIYSQPPIVGGVLGDAELDPEKNAFRALSRFEIDKKRRNKLIDKIAKSYLSTDNMKIGVDTTDFILNSYQQNHLEHLGLPFLKDPQDLDIEERRKLLDLANSILEAGIISKNGFKSYNNYGEFEIAEKSFENIGKAYNISSNVSEILKIENTPDLRQIFLNNQFEVDDIFKLRHLKTAKYFRKWINEVGENANSNEVTEAYLAEIKEAKSFFNTTKGKIIKNTFMYGATSGLGMLIAGQVGAVVGGVIKPFVEPAVDYGLGLIEEFTVDGLFAGKTPKIYIDKLKDEIK